MDISMILLIGIYFLGFFDDGLIYNRVINPKEFSIQAE